MGRPASHQDPPPESEPHGNSTFFLDNFGPMLRPHHEGIASSLAFRARWAGAPWRRRHPIGTSAPVRAGPLGRAARAPGGSIADDHERHPPVHRHGARGTDLVFPRLVWWSDLR